MVILWLCRRMFLFLHEICWIIKRGNVIMSVNNSPQFRWKTFQKYTHTHTCLSMCVYVQRGFTHMHTHTDTQNMREKKCGKCLQYKNLGEWYMCIRCTSLAAFLWLNNFLNKNLLERLTSRIQGYFDCLFRYVVLKMFDRGNSSFFESPVFITLLYLALLASLCTAICQADPPISTWRAQTSQPILNTPKCELKPRFF